MGRQRFPRGTGRTSTDASPGGPPGETSASCFHVRPAGLGTDTLAYHLLAGALLAITPSLSQRVRQWKRTTSLASLTGVGAVVVLATSQVATGPITRGIAVRAATGLLIVALEADVGTSPCRSR